MRERFGSAAAVIVLAALSLSTFTYVTTETLPIGLLPLIAAGLGTSTSAIGLLVTAYALVVVVASIPLTRATQRLPRRRLLCGLLVVFVISTVVSALAQNYAMLLAARILTALTQAVFWAVIMPATAALFRSEVRARAIALLYAGGSVATLAGVPLGTWLGQQANWRLPMFVMSGLGLLILAVIATLMPESPPGQSETDHGTAPDRGRFRAVVVCTALMVTGAFTVLTYINPFLTGVSGFAEGAVGPLLFVRGVAGLTGVLLAGRLAARNGWLTMTGLVAAQAVALAVQWIFGTSQLVTVPAIAVSGFALAAMSAALGARILEVAPGSSDLASAATSTAFNVGIMSGAFLGSVLLPVAGVRSTALAGTVLTLLALAAVLAEPRLSTRRRPVTS